MGFLYLVPQEVSRLPASGFRIVDYSLSSPFIPEIGPPFILYRRSTDSGSFEDVNEGT